MFSRIFFAAVLMSLCFANGAWALTLGTNITISDKVGTGTGWYGAQEDNEVEPGNVATQAWDLEGFFLNGTTLAMVGGYNFATGVTANNHTYKSGDIFIDVTGDVKYGPANTGTGGDASTPVIANSFGYDYVVDLDFTNKRYSVLRLDTSSLVVKTELVYYSQNDESNPWRYVSDGSLVAGFQNLQIRDNVDYFTGLLDTGFLGVGHNALLIDLSFLGHGAEFTAHFTMECGNDNLMGHGVLPAPEPGTLVLVGAGLIGLLAWRRRN